VLPGELIGMMADFWAVVAEIEDDHLRSRSG
jgi:hypothetical protein